ncbi:hypothetical protein PR048_004752 [Dryococelus australis]|uniref:Uncharacterized protein n=1 Tax=Dryococelus australis TaxID=614101 RepID=A0ABQ9I6A0_9NEOP|nr:hypothetical protein PR048_004752 [Dryococelus australis]
MAMKLWVSREDIQNQFIFHPGELQVVMWTLAALGKYVEGSGIDQAWMEAGWAILGYHAFTGSDVTCRFAGITKQNCFKKFLECDDKILSCLASLGIDVSEPSPAVEDELERCITKKKTSSKLKILPAVVKGRQCLYHGYLSSQLTNLSNLKRLQFPVNKCFTMTCMGRYVGLKILSAATSLGAIATYTTPLAGHETPPLKQEQCHLLLETTEFNAGLTIITRKSDKIAPTPTKIFHQPMRSKVSPTNAASTKMTGLDTRLSSVSELTPLVTHLVHEVAAKALYRTSAVGNAGIGYSRRQLFKLVPRPVFYGRGMNVPTVCFHAARQTDQSGATCDAAIAKERATIMNQRSTLAFTFSSQHGEAWGAAPNKAVP